MFHIDSDDYKAAGIDTFMFPGGEPHCKVPDIDDAVSIYLKLRTWKQVGYALAVLETLSRRPSHRLYVFIPYFPGARQDKPQRGRDPAMLMMMARMFNVACGPTSTLAVFDPHSQSLGLQLKPTFTLMPKDLFIPLGSNVAGIIAPDEGAFVRAQQFRNAFYPDANMVRCEKKRDPNTGWITGYTMSPLPRAGRYIIVDDICDGGATFNLLAQEFADDPFGFASELELFVSHGIFSKDVDNRLSSLDYRIRHVTTTDSWCEWESGGRLTVLPLAPLWGKIRGEHA